MALSVRRLRRVESWSTWKAAGGVRQYVLPEVIALTASTTLFNDKLSLVIPLDSPAAAYLTSRSIIRIDESDSVYDEWKIVDRATDELAGTVTISATSLRSTELAESSVVERVDSDGVVVHEFESLGLTPAVHIATWILPALSTAGITWVAAGTITPTAPLDLTFSWDTPLSALLRIAEASQCELDLRRNGNTGYLIDLIAKVNTSAQRADLRVDKNLANLHTDENTIDQATRVFPRGMASTDLGQATMSRAQWKVTVIVSNVVTLADPAGGAGPIKFDDQLNGRYLRKPDGTLTLVTASISSAQTVTVASASGLSVNDLLQFRENSAGRDMVSLDNPAARATYGIKTAIHDVPDVPGTNNLLKNPFARSWPGAPSSAPTNWSKVGTPTVDKQTAAPFTALGGQSIKVTSTIDGQGLKTEAVPIFPTTDNPYVSAFGRLWVASGSVRVEMILTIPAGIKVLPIAPAVASNSITGQWEDLGVSGIDANILGATAIAIQVVQLGTAASVFYVDAAQATQTPSQEPLVEGSGGTRLWQEANEALRTSSLPVVSYSVPLVDLEQLDPVKWAESALIIGAPARVRDPRLQIDIATRIVELNRDYLNAASTSVVLSNKFDDLTDLLAAFKRSGRNTPVPTEPGTGEDARFELRLEVIAETFTERTYRVTKGAFVDAVWVGIVEFAQPLPASPWTAVAAASLPLPIGTDTFSVTRPAGKRVMLIQVEPRGADLAVTGKIWQASLEGAPAQLPAIEVAYIESGDTGTVFAAISGRGESLVSVQAQVKVGAQDAAAYVNPNRSAGDYSYVKGRTLQPDEYEHDVLKDATRISTVQFRLVVQGTGEVVTTDPVAFDWNSTPDILLAYADGSVVVVVADSDAQSIRLQRTGGTWEYWIDGKGVRVDVQRRVGTGTGDQTPMLAGTQWPILISAFAKPKSDPDVLTSPVATATVNVTGSTAPAEPEWTFARVQAPVIGLHDVDIILQAVSAPAGYTARVNARYNDGSGWINLGVITGALSPALSSPPTTQTDYTWSGLGSTYDATANENGAIPIDLEVTTEIVNAANIVVATETHSAIWYYGAQAVPPGGAPPESPPPGVSPTPPTPPPLLPFTPPAAIWLVATVTKPSVGSRTVSIGLQADSANGTVQLLERIDDGYGWSDPLDISGSVSPAVSTPPTSLTSYTRTVSLYQQRTSTGSPIVYELTVNIIQDGIVVAQQVVSTNWLYTDTRL